MFFDQGLDDLFNIASGVRTLLFASGFHYLAELLGQRRIFLGLPQNLWVKNWGFAPDPRIFKAWLGCPTGAEEKHPWQVRPARVDAPLAPRRAEYPLSGCVPAEPDSVSSAL